MNKDLVSYLARETRGFVAEQIAAAVAPLQKALHDAECEIAELRAKSSSSFVTHDEIASRVEQQVERAIARLPKPKDGEDAVVDYERIAGTLKSLVDAIPAPKDGTSVTIDDVRPLLEQMVAAIPKPELAQPGKDAVVDYDRIGDMIALGIDKALGNAVASLPKPKDGENGKDAVVDYALVKEFVAAAAVNAVAALPKPQDGKSVTLDDVRPMIIGALGPELVNLPRAASVTIDDVRPLVAEVVAKEVAALPKPKDGRDGRDVDEDLIVKRVLALVPVPKDGKDGKDGAIGPRGEKGEPGIAGKDGAPGARGEQGLPGKDGESIRGERGEKGDPGRDGEAVHPDTVQRMVRDAIDEAIPRVVAMIPKGEDGRSVDPVELSSMVHAEIGRQFDGIRPYIKGERGEPGQAGRDGIGVEDLTADYSEEEGICRIFVGKREIGRITGLPHERGVYKRGRYRKGAIVTYGGSGFIARCDTDEPIGTDPPSPHWRLLVKRGRDAA